jgi:membrane protein YqaA with SNARE-associated domain
MLLPQSILVLSVWNQLLQIRSIGLIFIGIADNSVIPLPGSMDVFTIWLAATNPKLWFYYAVCATLAAMAGGYITYWLGRKGGKEALERRLRKRQAAKICDWFERWGFAAVAVPALLPPPFPIVPFLLAAGGLQYPRRKFLAALAIGRGIRFTVAAALGATYGSWIVGFFARYYKFALFTLLAFAVIAGVFAFLQYHRYRREIHAAVRTPQPKAA